MRQQPQAGSSAEDSIAAFIQRMTLPQKIGQMFLQEFIGTHEVSDIISRKAEEGLLGGVIYYSGSNVEDTRQLTELTQLIRDKVMDGALPVQPFISLDQEGGQLCAVHRGAVVFPGNMALGFTRSAELSREVGMYVGNELRAIGIDINYAPVLDVAYDVREGIPIVDNRMFSCYPEVAAELGAAYIEGLQSSGVIACCKHFPGQRLAEKDSHHTLDRVEYSLDRLQSVEMLPFQRAVETGVGAVMGYHALYSALDAEYPASFSTQAMRYLRETLGHQGLVITDDLIMGAIRENWSDEEVIRQSILSGVDLIIFSGVGEWIIDFVEAEVRSGRIPEAVIDAAVTRILTAKKGLEQQQNLRPEITHAPDFAVGRQLARRVCEHSIVHYAGDGECIPLPATPESRVSVIMANPARLVMADTVNFYDISLKQVIEQRGYHSYIKEAFMPWAPTEEESLSLFDIGFTSDYVIFVTTNAFRFSEQLEILKRIYSLRENEVVGGREYRVQEAPRIIAVAGRSPSDAALLKPYADEVLVTGGITPLQIEALVDVIFGKVPAISNPEVVW
ncbi:MAG: glycoside hydrolase family 3 protein [Spirochaeta sp.]